MCQSGYAEPNTTQASQTSTENMDCVPLLDPSCATGEHRDDQTNTCVADSTCLEASLCEGSGATDGYYDADLNKCLCSNVPSDAAAYCDETC